jgi:hypothetical protein
VPVSQDPTNANEAAPLTKKSWLSKLLPKKKQTVKDLLITELKEVHERLEFESKRFELDFPTEKEKGKRLMYLFQKDLMPGISGQVLDAKDSRDDKVVARSASFAAKVCGWLFLGILNLSMLFYVFLFAVSQDTYRQRAWAKSFGTWMVMEVLITSSIMVCVMHVFLPTLMLKEVTKIKGRLIQSIAKYHKALSKQEAENKGGSYMISKKAHNTDDEDDDLNTAKYLFVSYRLACLYPDLRVSQVIRQFSTPWPRQSYQHVTDFSKQYNKGTAAIYKSISMVAMFFVTNLLAVPLSMQDMVISMCTTVTTGYTILIHLQLYQIYPVLIAIPTILIAAIMHFFVESGKSSSKIQLAKMLQVKDEDDHDKKRRRKHKHRKHKRHDCSNDSVSLSEDSYDYSGSVVLSSCSEEYDINGAAAVEPIPLLRPMQSVSRGHVDRKQWVHDGLAVLSNIHRELGGSEGSSDSLVDSRHDDERDDEHDDEHNDGEYDDDDMERDDEDYDEHTSAPLSRTEDDYSERRSSDMNSQYSRALSSRTARTSNKSRSRRGSSDMDLQMYHISSEDGEESEWIRNRKRDLNSFDDGSSDHEKENSIMPVSPTKQR